MANNAKIYDPSALIQAGIDPKTGLPRKVVETPNDLKVTIKKQLRVLDEQDAVNRYVWRNLPKGLSGRKIEEILYYRGQGMFFTLNNKFYFLPYTLSAPEGSTGIDVYGRFTGVTPLVYNGTANKKEEPWIRGKIFKPVYEAIDLSDFEDASYDEILDAIKHSCVLLHDYTPQISQMVIPRQMLNDPLLDPMSDCIPFMRTALLNSTGVCGIRVNNENEQPEVERMSQAINGAALNGKKFVGMVGGLDVQELTGGTPARAEEFLLAMQALDNYRLSLYGLSTGGIFQKKSHMLEAEQNMNSGNAGLVLEDGLRNRNEAATIFNSIYGTNMWCEVSETVLNIDKNGDGYAGEDDEYTVNNKYGSNTAATAETGEEEV